MAETWASPRVDISSTCKIGQKLGVSPPLLICPHYRDHPGYCIAEFRNPRGMQETEQLVMWIKNA
jgi:hypothetical protein